MQPASELVREVVREKVTTLDQKITVASECRGTETVREPPGTRSSESKRAVRGQLWWAIGNHQVKNPGTILAKGCIASWRVSNTTRREPRIHERTT